MFRCVMASGSWIQIVPTASCATLMSGHNGVGNRLTDGALLRQSEELLCLSCDELAPNAVSFRIPDPRMLFARECIENRSIMKEIALVYNLRAKNEARRFCMKSSPTRRAVHDRLRVNQRLVAKRAGVSSATVSRVINGSPTVKEDTAEHVRRVLKELNFIPNPIATALKYGRSKTYGVIIPDINNPFFPEFLGSFEEALVENDFELQLATTEASETKLVNSVRRMIMRQVDGVVVMASEYETRAIEPFFNRQIPIVTVDRRRVEKGSSDVAIDFEDGYRKAVLHLRELGHEQVGFVAGSLGIRTSEVRFEAFREALKYVGLKFDPRLMRTGDYRVAGGDAAMRSLLKESRLPTAVVTVNDLSAFGVLRALHECRVEVPAQMSVVGFDGIQLSDAIYPALTTIHVPARDLAQACIRALDYSRANITRRGLRISVHGSLVVRGSTAIAPSRSRS